jgi:aminopeptidase-like protein/aminoglycoside N3'-acetyltransferase
MTVARPDYTKEQVTAALRRAGVRQGDTLFLQVDLDRLGMPEGGAAARSRLVLDAVRHVLAESGTLLVPTYTFSFCRYEPFDVQQTPTRGGPWSPTADFLEYVRGLPATVRSADPIHSVAGQGPRALELLRDVAPTCFGAGSVFHRLVQSKAKVCMLGLGLDEATVRHHSEEMAEVPFRYKKLFTGTIADRGTTRKRGWIYNVRIMADNGYPDGRRLEQLARDEAVCRAERIGCGELLVVEAEAYHALTLRALADDPWYTARGPEVNPVEAERSRVGVTTVPVTLPANADVTAMMEGLWHLPRHIISDGYDVALRALAEQLPMTVHEYPSGMECWSWLVPEKWTCHEAYLERMNGERLFSYADNPLHAVSYSLPFEGEVTREQLLAHLHVHPKLRDAVPFIFKYYERDWGLCCSEALRDTLTDERYRVVIRSEFSYGTLKVGEVVARGRTDECIVFCAHLCHPAMVNDDLSGVVVGMQAMRALQARRDLKYTYRFLIVPETIGSVAHLSRHPALIPAMKGGIFLEMLGTDHPHALQLSFEGDTAMDRAGIAGLRAVDPQSWTAPFRSLAGNDERQFNAPGVRVPMLSLSRMLPPAHPQHPYREYHSSFDTPANASVASLQASVDAVLSIVEQLERRAVPVNRFSGEVFCSRYGIHIDPFENPEGHRALFDIMYLIDGTRSVEEIAERCGISAAAARATIAELEQHGLVSW